MSTFLSAIAARLNAIGRGILSFLGRKPVTPEAAGAPDSGVRYVVVDLEWNQYPKWLRTPTSREGVAMPHEIIQIGAVKVDEFFRVIETFTIGVRLQGRRKLSKHVAKVIHKTQEEIDQGVDFPAAYAYFSDWSADVERFFTWGGDDFRVLENNLAYYNMGALDAANWFDAQLIYARQVRGDRVQTALATAAEKLGVEEDGLMQHDALNDAYVTVGVCSKLDMLRGIAEIEAQRAAPKPPQRKNENLLFMQKKFVSASSEDGFETRALCKQHCAALPVPCPECDQAMKLEPQRVVSGDRWMRMASCKDHGKHLVRYRVRHKADHEFVWSRAVYAPDAELERHYREKLSQRQRRRPARGGKGAPTAQASVAKSSVAGGQG